MSDTRVEPTSNLFVMARPLEPIVGLTTMTYEKSGSDAEVLTIKNMPVFRSGTFADSTGWVSTWEALHIQEMVRHFDYLRARGTFVDVPVRAGHVAFLGGNSLTSLIGYHTGLRSEKRFSKVYETEFEYLLADYEILDKDAADKIRSGLWRNRSAEIGTYRDNSEAEYSPTYMGVAYVDISAVESLNGFSKNSNYGIQMEETMGSTPTPPLPNPPAAPPAPAPEPTPDPVPPTPKPNASFTVAGVVTSDYAAVQTAINEFESQIKELAEFRANAIKAAREDFVKGLAAANKIGAEQIDAFNNFASGLSEDQFTAWSATFGAAAPLPMFDNHGAQNHGDAPPAPEPSAEPEVGAVDKGVIRRLHSAGVSVEKIKMTAQYARLAATDGFSLEAVLSGK